MTSLLDSLLPPLSFPLFKVGTLSWFSIACCRLYALYRIPYFRIFSFAFRQVQYRPRQSSSFIGMPTPANALFWGSLTVGAHSFLISDSFNAAYLFILVVIMSFMLVAEIPMFSLKFKSLAWKQNKVSYIFLIVCIPLLIFFKISSFAAIILWYIILSL